MNYTIDPANGDVLFDVECLRETSLSIGGTKVGGDGEVVQPVLPTIVGSGKSTFRWNRRKLTGEIVEPGDYNFTVSKLDPGENGDPVIIDWTKEDNSSKNISTNLHLGGSPLSDLMVFKGRGWYCKPFGETQQLISNFYLNNIQERFDSIAGKAQQGVSKVTNDGTLIYIQCYASISTQNLAIRKSFITAFDPDSKQLHDFGTGINLFSDYGNFPAFAIADFIDGQGQQGDLLLIQSIAAQKGSGYIFQLQKDVSGSFSRVFTYAPPTLKHTTNVGPARSCKCDGSGNLWILYAGSIKKWSANNTALTDTGIGFSIPGNPQCFDFAADYSYLEVTLADTHQLFRYDMAGNLLVTLFLSGGYANGPAVIEGKYNIDYLSHIALLPDGKRFMYEQAWLRVVLQAPDGTYIDEIKTNNSLLDTTVDKGLSDRKFFNMHETLVDATKTKWNERSKPINWWGYGLPDNSHLRGVATSGGVRLALLENFFNPKLVKLVDGVGIVETGFQCSNANVELHLDGLRYLDLYDSETDNIGLRCDINFQPITRSNGNVTVGTIQRLGQISGTGNTPFYSGNIATLAAWEPLDDIGDKIVIWHGGRASRFIHHLGIYSLAQEKFLYKAMPSLGPDWQGVYLKNEPLFDEGVEGGYPGCRMRVIKAGNNYFIVTVQQLQFYYGSRLGSFSYIFGARIFDDKLNYLGQFGRTGTDAQRSLEDSGFVAADLSRMANSALTQSMLMLPDGRVGMHTGEDGPHSANHFYRLLLPTGNYRETIRVTLSPISASNLRYAKQIDLMEGVPVGKAVPFVQGMGGWKANPAPYDNETGTLKIEPNVRTVSYPSFQVSINFNSDRVNVFENIINESNLGDWALYFSIGFFGNPSDNTNTNGDVGQQSFRLVDMNGKIVSDLIYGYGTPHDSAPPQIAMNGATPIWVAGQPNPDGFYRDDLNQTIIGRKGNKLFLIMGQRRIDNISPLDPTADLNSIGKALVYSEQSGNNRNYQLVIAAGEMGGEMGLFF